MGQAQQAETLQAAGIPALTFNTNEAGEGQYVVTLQILAIMTALAFIPSAVIMMTAFTRIVVVLAILRQAMGLQQTPSNQVIIGIALFLSFFVMYPVLQDINARALQPYIAEDITPLEAVETARAPIHDFMLSQTRQNDLDMFTRLAESQAGLDVDGIESPTDIPLTVLIPAFVTSELKTAFQIGFLLFIPFLIIDLVVASVLMSMGMMMLSPLIISLPFKIMMFVLVDGWALVMGSMAASFGI
ncbi:MAG: flagellar type III secretion system pore protein FliP [Natronospirillum sp.]|uniref:flagellar type III secretion system pore protein FliP n=1 Tax=Natronospirillum sp. TaxID=2812955 RepID=UPI0025E267A9|nr:flagellar type III secretion system pore protein FliP [Natronospirillum sp.]MCH8551284.1 flagellar type III secretion system pore protein FliP [Natronospirillum sp.]